MKARHHLYLDDALTEQLGRLARKPGSSKSGIVADALRAYLARGAASEVDAVMKARLDRFARAMARVERNQDVLLETLALYVRWQLRVDTANKVAAPDYRSERYRVDALPGRSGGRLTMVDLKLAKLPDRTPTKITITVSAELNQALREYAEAYAAAYRVSESVSELIPYMLNAFMAGDGGFRKMKSGNSKLL